MAIKTLALSNFAKAGINSDLMPWDLGPSFLTDLRNVRVSYDAVSAFGGYSEFVDFDATSFSPGSVMYLNSTNGQYWLVPGDVAIFAYTGSSWEQLGPGSAFGDPNLWTMCKLANVPVFNHPSVAPQYWATQSTADNLVYLPWDATQTWEEKGERCQVMRSHKQFLFAMNLDTTSYGQIPDGVRWSSPADINDVPATWDETDVTNVAGFTTLGGTGGRIVDGLGLRDAFVIYRENAITIFDYMPNSPYVWRIRELMSNVGVVGLDCVVEVKGVHYFIGDGDIYYNDGNKVESILHGRLRRRFVSNYDPTYYYNSFAVVNTPTYEIWFCIPEVGNEYPNVAYMYNWRDNTWAIRDIPPTPMAALGVAESGILTWDTVPGEWNTTPLRWTQAQLTPQDESLVCVTRNVPQDVGAPDLGQMLFLDKQPTPPTAYDSFIERTGLALEGLGVTTTINALYPHMAGPGIVTITVGSQDHAGSAVRWKDPVVFVPGSMKKINVRTTGELHCFRIYRDNSDQDWSISGIDIEYVNAGLR